MESKGSLLYSQEPSSGPSPEQDESSPHPPTHFPKIHSNVIFPSMCRCSEWSHPVRFTNQNLFHCCKIKFILLLSL